ncbi:hypothetical protein VP01_625g5 [Puccinia sorghi]|uniref:Uncharacterized protein n=1 Tax=Puccinia sorghi TaxID=27349 RepID=A0A0L6UIJ2_9BASI|nr:hypothetical protein VP01_625g5 [Puccinia sorghi]
MGCSFRAIHQSLVNRLCITLTKANNSKICESMVVKFTFIE